MPYMPVTSSMFLLAETREQPMHVGGLQLFVPREGQSASELAEEMIESFAACTEIHPLFRKRPASPVTLLGNVAWSYDDEIDFDYHVRRAVLPRPGRVRELLRYISLNHGTLLDRYRPMWEVHIIEGLDDGRVAIYNKIHHSIVDGVSALRLLQRMMSNDPDDRSGTAPWDPALVGEKRPRKAPSIRTRISGLADTAVQVAGLGPAAAKVAVAGFREGGLVPPLSRAPRTILDVAIGSARRFASQQWELSRLRAVADALDITINDIVVAMCSGALRSYLIDRDALPDTPLIAAVPVSMHTDGDHDGNAVTAIMVNLATDEPDPERRLAKMVESVRGSKSVIRGLRPLQALALGAANFAPLAFATVPGFVQYVRPQFNIIISNVPGPSEHLYWNGARLDGVYPVSIPMEGLALNITVTTTVDHINFGLIGARAQVPSLQRLLTHLDTALEELEKLASIPER
ncbi:wax ester/triacylglycerol synthase family O-acyltransferase [Gordonia sp. zg691]|uniref:Diacylglycerol O-acyltransferase n=1 Tax=Gordonia jinghuaiqii TaxID=2758710 RepID=A0A7D7QWN9_9ACTN|nr:wax ester/triacylglycerol synthase family O-acyltransferase [Gordonia jinghuaiqii]MBD0860394.1 wax ester/triacylglycerol synthase family O-acyltransferase [Gordonia jinghuaiqii]MCR5978336.1 wax ester/triacylglycerol synthase family O-acyltransferase [Gordonia jinghuaiqii]QMT01229.1 wax ester/triacylglycerol synthase family O-acyltransferase [Gordonia jinghuaiqii]